MEMWERFDTFGHQNICFTMKMKDFTLKESPPAMFKMLDVTGPGVGRTWKCLEYRSFVSIGVAKVETGNHGFHHQIAW